MRNIFISILFVFISTLFFSCDNMDRDELLNGISVPDSSETEDNNEEVLDENNVPDVAETEDNYVQPDEENTESPECGNAVIESGESCDSNSSPCSSILGDNYEGNAPCRSDCSDFDTSYCSEVQQDTVVYEIVKSKCRGCGRCPRGCKEGALTMSGGYAVIDPEKCTGCGDCVAYCPFDAIVKSD